jgi:hypothetical protein
MTTRYVIELNVPSEHVARAQFARVTDILTTDESARLVEVSDNPAKAERDRLYQEALEAESNGHYHEAARLYEYADDTDTEPVRKVLAAHNMGEDG